MGIHLGGRDYTDKEKVGKVIQDLCAKMNGSDVVFIGYDSGFSATITYKAVRQEYRPDQHERNSLPFNSSGHRHFGNFTRMYNTIDVLSIKLEQEKSDLAVTIRQHENVKVQLVTLFSREVEPTEEEQRMKEWNILMNMDQKDNALIDEAPAVDGIDSSKL